MTLTDMNNFKYYIFISTAFELYRDGIIQYAFLCVVLFSLALIFCEIYPCCCMEVHLIYFLTVEL